MQPPRRVAARLAGILLAASGVLAEPAAPALEPEDRLLLPAWEVSESRLLPAAVPVRATAVLPADAWSGRGIATLAEALRRIPGAVTQESFGGFEPPRLSIRGSGVQSAPSSRGIALLLDRLPLGLADGSFNSALLDPLLGGGLQVHRGIDAWREAGAVLGGAIDVRGTSAGTNDRGFLRADAGGFGARRIGAAGSGQIGSSLLGQAAAAWARQDGFRAHSRQERLTAHTTVSGPAFDGGRWSAGLYHAAANYEVPGPLTFAMAMAQPSSVSPEVVRDRPRRDARLTRLSAGYEERTADREMELGASVGRTTDEFHQLRANGVSRSASTDASWRGTVAQRFDSGIGAQELRLRAMGSHGWRRVSRLANVLGEAGAEFARDDLRPSTILIGLEDQVALARTLTGSIGIAQAWADRAMAGQTGGWTRATLPQAGLVWQASPRMTLHGSLFASAEPPTYDDLLVTAAAQGVPERRIQRLEDQRALTAEVGVRGEQGALTWDLAAYRAHWRHEILRLAEPDGTPRGAVNATPTTHEGVEASVRWRWSGRGMTVSVGASSVWTRCRFDQDPVYGRNRLAGVPPHVGEAELIVRFPRGAFVAGGTDWVKGATAADHAGQLGYDGRTLVHLRTGWRMARWTVFLQVRNLQDRWSIASTAGVLDLARNPAGAAIFLPAAGRSWTVGWELRL